ncbi:MAG: hypothetical protein LUF80_00595 [Oscillospiraceae bacterium]|nr:hypothetical protein [Oscillospiraceae bacterium]
MAAKKTTETTEAVAESAEETTEAVAETARDEMEELVSYSAPLDPKSTSRDILVAVNGETIRIKRGETVQIKRKFVEALNNADRQALAAYRAMHGQ